MPSFDVVSEVDKHELTNAVDTANRELGTRFDFKGQDASFELDGFVVNQKAPSDFQLKQMFDILRGRLAGSTLRSRARLCPGTVPGTPAATTRGGGAAVGSEVRVSPGLEPHAFAEKYRIY